MIPGLPIDPPSFQSLKSKTKADIESLKQELQQTLNDFPYDSIHLEHDEALASLIRALAEPLHLDLSQEHISKQMLLEALKKTEKTNTTLDPALSFIQLIQKTSIERSKARDEQAKKLDAIRQDIDFLNLVMGKIQSGSTTQKVDFRNNSEVKALIDEATKRFNLPPSAVAYVYDNKHDVLSFLNQQIQILTHKASGVTQDVQNEIETIKIVLDMGNQAVQQDRELKSKMIQNQT